MAPSSSSTKKAAQLAQKGKGKKVRFQGGTLFPLIVAIVVVLGVGTIVYARQTIPADDSSPPTVNDHWHAAYGFYLCDTWEQLAGNLEETDTSGQLISSRFLRTGIHSHDDGVIHWHPIHLGGGRQERQAGRVPRRLRSRARQRLAEVPRRPARRQGVHRGRDQVRHRGRGTAGRRVGLVQRHRRRHHLHRQLRQHPDQERRDGVLDRVRAARHRRSDAAVGRRSAGARRGRCEPGPPRGPDEHDGRAVGAVTDGTVTGDTVGCAPPARRRPDARGRARRRVRHPDAAAHEPRSEVDAAGRARADDLPPRRPPRRGWRHRRDPGARVQGRTVPGGIPRTAIATGLDSTTPSSPNRSTPPVRSGSRPNTRGSTTRSS